MLGIGTSITTLGMKGGIADAADGGGIALPWLPDPAYAVDGTEITVPNLGKAVAAGNAWYVAGAEQTNWWIPPGAAVVFDRKNARYAINGAPAAIGDFSSVSVGGYTRHRLDGNNLGINASQACTVLVEVDDDGGYANTETFFAMTHSAGTGGTTVFSFNSAGSPNVYHVRSGTGAINANLTFPFCMPAEGGAAAQTYLHPLARGRRRMVFSVPASGQTVRAQSGWPALTDLAPVTGAISVNRIAFGHRVFNGLVDQPVLTDAQYDSLRVVIWPYAMTKAEVEAACRMSEKGLPGIYILGDSAGATQAYGAAGRMFADAVIETLSVSGYRPFVLDQVSSSSWDLAVVPGTQSMNTRVNARAAQYAKFNWLLLDYVWDEFSDPTKTINGVNNVLAKLEHEAIMLCQHQMPNNYLPGQQQYIDSVAANSTVSTWLGSRFWELYPALSAAATGTPDDVAAIANGTIPPSITSDGLHLNATIGNPAASASAVAKMSALGWLTTGQWR